MDSKKIKTFFNQQPIQTNPNIPNNEMSRLFKWLNVKVIAEALEKYDHTELQHHIFSAVQKHSTDTSKKPYISIMLYMAICSVSIPRYPNLFNYRLELEPSNEGDLTQDLCSIIWCVDPDTEKKVLVVKPGMMRCEHDQLLYQLFEYMRKEKLVPRDMANIFINSMPAVINISQVILPKLKNNHVNKINYHLIYETVTNDEIEISFEKNKHTNGLVLVGVQEILDDCSSRHLKQWIQQKPLDFVLMLGILRLINARDLKMNGIMRDGKGNPIIIDCENFLQERRSSDKQPIADIHIPFIAEIINETIPDAVLKIASGWFQHWKDKKVVLSSFMNEKKFLFETDCHEIQTIDKKCLAQSNDDFTNQDEDSMIFNDNFIFQSPWHNITDQIDADSVSTDTDKTINNKDSLSDDEVDEEVDGVNGLDVGSGTFITRYTLHEALKETNDSDDEFKEDQLDAANDNNDKIEKKHTDKTKRQSILRKSQLAIFCKNINSLAENFSSIANSNNKKAPKKKILEIMQFLDKQWLDHYRKFQSLDINLRFQYSSPASLVGLYSPMSMKNGRGNSTDNNLSNDSANNVGANYSNF